MIKRFFAFVRLLCLIPLLSGCFFANLFDFGPKIDLGKNQWKIVSFTLGGEAFIPSNFEDIPFMRFDTKELKIHGNTGCNRFFASYVWIDDKKIEIRRSGLTRKMCQSDESVRFEQKLMEEFDGGFEVIEGENTLMLKNENLQINLIAFEGGLPQTEDTQQEQAQ